MRRMFEERRSVWQRAPIQRKCPSLVLEGVGFFPSAQPSGFFFVGIGPASGAPHFLLSWPPPVGDSSTTTILLPRHPLVPPPLLQHHPLSPSRQWTVGPARGEKLNLVHERRGGNDWTVGERGCHQVVEIYIWKYHSYAKAKVTIEKRQSQKRARHAGGKSAMDSLALLSSRRWCPLYPLHAPRDSLSSRVSCQIFYKGKLRKLTKTSLKQCSEWCLNFRRLLFIS